MCSSMLFSPSHSIWSSYIRDTYVCMCVIWTLGHRAFLEGFYKLFTNKIHTFSIFLSLFLVPSTIRVFFSFRYCELACCFVSTSNFNIYPNPFVFVVVVFLSCRQKSSNFPRVQNGFNLFHYHGGKKRAVEESPKTHSKR